MPKVTPNSPTAPWRTAPPPLIALGGLPAGAVIPTPRSDRYFTKKLGRRIAQRRIELRFTQDWLASVSGLHRTQIAQLETGRRFPSLRTVRVLARALKIPMSELLRGL